MNPASFLLNAFLDDRERWPLWLPILLMLGLALYFALPMEPPRVLLAFSPLLFALFILQRHRPYAPLVLASFLALSLGFNAAQIETGLAQAPMLKTSYAPVALFGTLERAEPLADGARLTLAHIWTHELPKDQRPLRLRIKTKILFKDVPPAGSRLHLWGPLWPPNDAAMPDGYDFRRQAFFKQLGGTGISYVEPLVVKNKDPVSGRPLSLGSFFDPMRRRLILETTALLPDPQQAMTAALLSGSQTGIGRPVMDAMRASGLSHLLSISGVHVSMMALLVYLPLRFLLALIPWITLRFPIKKIAAFGAIVATTAYTLLVGADPPTVRSALMTGIVFFAVMTDRKAMSLRLVALAAAAIMLVAPSATMGASFQMSFAAVLAMVAAYEKKLDETIREGLSLDLPRWVTKAGHALKDIILTSLIATAATTPFTIFHFQTFNFYGVAANMIGIPLTTLWIMPCLLLIYITLPLGLAAPFIKAAGWGVALLIKLAETVAAWPYATIPMPAMPTLAFGLLIGGGLWLCLWRRSWRYLGLLPILAGCCYPLFTTTPSVFIADDAPVWAVQLEDGTMAVFGKRKENFVTAQWRQRLRQPDVLYFTPRALPENLPELSCDETMCLYEKEGKTIAFVLPPDKKAAEPVAPFCPVADVIVSYDDLTGCTASIVIDKASLEEKGAHSLTFDDGRMIVDTVRQKQGQRPWSVP